MKDSENLRFCAECNELIEPYENHECQGKDQNV